MMNRYIENAAGTVLVEGYYWLLDSAGIFKKWEMCKVLSDGDIMLCSTGSIEQRKANWTLYGPIQHP